MSEPRQISELGFIVAVIFSAGVGILFGVGNHDGRIGLAMVLVTLGICYAVTRLWWYLED